MKNILYVLLTCMLWHPGYGQRAMKLNIGDPVAVQRRFALLNQKDSIDFNSLKGKLIIIDFFTTGCIPCIKSVPKMEALQKKFGDRLQVIMVTSDTRSSVLRLMGRSDIMKANKLPVITDDTLFRKLFPYQVVPTHVWIDGNSVVRYITDGESTNEENLQKLLSNGPLILNKAQTTFKPGQHLWEQKTDGLFLVPEYISMFTDKIKGIGSSSGFLRDSVTNRIIGYRSTNVSPITILRDAFRDANNRFSNSSRVLIDVKDTKSVLCYELALPVSKSDSVCSIIKQDMRRLFEIEGKVETRKTKCLILKVIDRNKLTTEGQPRSIRYKTDDHSDFEFKNVSFKDFFSVTFGNVNWQYPIAIFDETGYTANVDIKLKGPIKDLESIKVQLLSYGLSLTESNRMVDILFITNTYSKKTH